MTAVVDIYTGPLVWGRADCCTCACDVFARLHGVDPMAPLRGLYSTEAGALALIRSWGGWRRMTARLAAMAGLRGGAGAVGELGLVRQPSGYTLAICVGRNQWAGRIDGGFETTGSVVVSWQC